MLRNTNILGDEKRCGYSDHEITATEALLASHSTVGNSSGEII